jgi:hypothetical protein
LGGPCDGRSPCVAADASGSQGPPHAVQAGPTRLRRRRANRRNALLVTECAEAACAERESGEAERVSNDRWERPQQARRAKRLSNGTVVVAEYDASGAVVRETYYTGDEAWITKIVDYRMDQASPPEAE